MIIKFTFSDVKIATLIGTVSLLTLLGFKDVRENTIKEYLCITMEIAEDYPVFYISQTNKPLEVIVYMDKNSTRRYNFLKKDYERSGTKVIDKSLGHSTFDYSIAYEIISKHEQEGWQLKSNSFSHTGYDDFSDTRTNQFFFTR